MIDEDVAREVVRHAGADLPVGPAPYDALHTAGRRRAATLRAARVAGTFAVVVALTAVPVAVTWARRDAAAPTAARRSVPLPPVAARPVEVVRAYVSALDAHDIETAKALSTAEQVAQTEAAEDSWYTNTISITDLRVGEPVPQSGEGSRGAGMADVVFVPVRFVLKQRVTGPDMPGGDTVWGYLVGRATPGERWLILDEGPV